MKEKLNKIFFSYRSGLLLALILLIASCAVKTTGHYQAKSGNENVDKTETEQKHHTGINILFLGDEGSHRPAERLKLVISYYSKLGINIYYTDRQEDLNLIKLKAYDVLMLYGARANLTREQETALYTFANEGGGIVAIHAGGGLFKESDAYVSLIGGSFKSHGTGIFKTKDIRPDHPVMKGVPNFESWDETYVHMKHNPDKTVLSLRVEGGHEEPWTWVRNQGRGRIFYTAWGHDYRTWNNTGFRKLIENAMRWTAGDWAIDANFSLPPFLYTKEELRIGKFGEPWQRIKTDSTITKVQIPLNPKTAIKYIVTEPEFSVELFATEPDVVKAIDMAWDEKGRLWILQSVDYPNDFLPGRVGHDRIKILEDTNGDNKADKVTVFAEGLNMPSSLVIYKGGVIVAQAPDILYLKDTNGDDKADSTVVLFTGWGKTDSHQVANNLQYGFDNQIWGAVGGSGFEGVVGGEKHKFNDGLYRFLPDGSKMERISNTSNNTWGLGFNEEGEAFASTANGIPAVHSLIPNRFYDMIPKRPGGQVRTNRNELSSIANSNRIFPIVDSVRQIDFPGGYTAAAGFQVYTAREFPEEYWDRMAFISEPTGHILTKLILEPNGSTYTARIARNLLASRDEWFAPVQSKVGPDGALWVIDWYNIYITHNSSVMPDGSETGEGKASKSNLRDKEHSRIYRVVYKDGNYNKNFNLKNAPVSKLVNALKNDNLFWRLTAQRLLVERGNTDVLPQLYKLIEDETIDKLGLNPGALHAIWTLKGLGALDGSNPEALNVVLDAFYHPSASVRRAALMALPRTQATLDKILVADFLPVIETPLPNSSYTLASNFRLLSDPKGLVATLLAVAEMPASEKVGQAAAEISVIQQKIADQGIRDALTAAAVQNQKSFLDRILTKQLPKNAENIFKTNVQNVVHNVSMKYAANGEFQSILSYLPSLQNADTTIGVGFVTGVLNGWPLNKMPVINTSDKDKLKHLHATLPETYKESLNKLAKIWESPDLFGSR